MSCTKDLKLDAKIRVVAWVGAEASSILHRKVTKLECITQLFYVIDEIVLRLKERQEALNGVSRADLSATID